MSLTENLENVELNKITRNDTAFNNLSTNYLNFKNLDNSITNNIIGYNHYFIKYGDNLFIDKINYNFLEFGNQMISIDLKLTDLENRIISLEA